MLWEYMEDRTTIHNDGLNLCRHDCGDLLSAVDLLGEYQIRPMLRGNLSSTGTKHATPFPAGGLKQKSPWHGPGLLRQ